MPERVVARNLQALQTARRLMPTVSAVRGTTNIGQSYTLQPGSIDRYDGTILIGQTYEGACYLRGNTLYVMPTAQFLHSYQLNQMAGQVVEATRWIEPAGRVTFALVLGMAVGAFGVIASAASASASIIKFAVFYRGHRREVDTAISHLGDIAAAFSWFNDTCPTTSLKLRLLAGQGLWEALRAAPQGASMTDGAAVAGRVIGTLSNPASAGMSGLMSTLASALKVILVRLPGAMARGSAERAQEAAAEFLQGLIDNSIPLNDAERAAITAEFNAHPEAVEKLAEIQEKAALVVPVLRALVQSFQVVDAPVT